MTLSTACRIAATFCGFASPITFVIACLMPAVEGDFSRSAFFMGMAAYLRLTEISLQRDSVKWEREGL